MILCLMDINATEKNIIKSIYNQTSAPSIGEYIILDNTENTIIYEVKQAVYSYASDVTIVYIYVDKLKGESND